MTQSPGRFAWLLGTNEQPPADIPDRDEFLSACDFALDCWQVLPVIAPKLFSWAGAQYDEEHVVRQIRDRITSLTVLARIQSTLCRRLSEALEQRRIPYVLLKSTAVRLMLYASPEQRCGKDIDIGVPARFVRLAERIAIEQGFVPSEWDSRTRRFHRADAVLREQVEARHYELGFLVKRILVRDLDEEETAAIRRSLPNEYLWHLTGNGELACYVYADIHHGISLDIPVDRIVQTSERLSKDGYTANVPRLDWVMLHLIFKIYWEGVHNYRKGGYQYADLIRALPFINADTFKSLLSLLKEFKLEAAGHYVLRRLETELHYSLSPEQRRFIQETAIAPLEGDPHEHNDLGDMWPKLWGYK